MPIGDTSRRKVLGYQQTARNVLNRGGQSPPVLPPTIAHTSLLHCGISTCLCPLWVGAEITRHYGGRKASERAEGSKNFALEASRFGGPEDIALAVLDIRSVVSGPGVITLSTS